MENPSFVVFVVGDLSPHLERGPFVGDLSPTNFQSYHYAEKKSVSERVSVVLSV